MKKIGILGTGMVGQTIGDKLVHLGYNVMMGSRTKNNEKSLAWVQKNGTKASHGTFEESVIFGEILFLCTKGDHTIDAIKTANIKNFENKTIIDISNPLDFSMGMPPSLFICNTDSLGEHVQSTLPLSNVVKTLNIVNAALMTSPEKTGGDPTMFIAGNNTKAKEEVKVILTQFGWKDIIDIGDITGARAMEMILPIWLRTMITLGTPEFALKAQRNK